ncbi:MAG: hypothetical protein U5P10_02025 [Spirochaetia bacterium]|nr:hypothetical protein [Spirochaetia bacterium]
MGPRRLRRSWNRIGITLANLCNATGFQPPMAEEFSEFESFKQYIEAHPGEHLVLKRNHPVSNMNVFDSADSSKLTAFGKQILEEDTLLVEKFETGYNLSISAFIDGKSHLILPPASDYTKAMDNDTGAITNGMGAICPVPVLSSRIHLSLLTEIIEPTLKGLQDEQLSYKGVFFFSLLIQNDGAKLTSYHVRIPVTLRRQVVAAARGVGLLLSLLRGYR